MVLERWCVVQMTCPGVSASGTHCSPIAYTQTEEDVLHWHTANHAPSPLFEGRRSGFHVRLVLTLVDWCYSSLTLCLH